MPPRPPVRKKGVPTADEEAVFNLIGLIDVLERLQPRRAPGATEDHLELPFSLAKSTLESLKFVRSVIASWSG